MTPVAFLVRCAGRVIRLLGRLNPMRSLQPELLRRAPIVWRTSVIHVFWYVVLGYAGLYLLGSLLPVERGDVHSLTALAFLRGLIWCLALLAAGYWVVTLVRTPLPDLRPRRVLLTAGLYFVCVHPMIGLPAAFMVPLTTSIAETVPDARFRDDMAFMEKFDFGFCAGEMGDGGLKRYRKVLDQHELGYARVNFFAEVSSQLRWQVHRNLREIASSKSCPGESGVLDERNVLFVSKPGEAFESPLEVEIYFRSVEYAKAYSKASGIAGIMEKQSNPVISSLSALIAAVLVFVTYSRASQGPKPGNFVLEKLRRSDWLGWAAPLALRSLDRPLVRVKPRLWATRIPTMTIFCTLLFLIAVPVTRLVTYSVESFPSRLVGIIPEEVLIISYICIVFLAFVFLLNIFMRSQRRRMQSIATTRDHMIAMSAFIVPWLPGLTGLVVYTFAAEQDVVLGATLAAAFIVYLSASVSYLLQTTMAMDVLRIFAYSVILAGIALAIVVSIDDEDIGVATLYLVVITYFGFLFSVHRDNVRRRRRIQRGVSQKAVRISRYMVIFTPALVFLMVLCIIITIEQMNIIGYSYIIEASIILAFTHGPLVFYFAVCRPLYASLGAASYQPAED